MNIDQTPPRVQSISSTLPSGEYGAGQIIDFVLNFSRPVFVTGTPWIPLRVNSTINVIKLNSTGNVTAGSTFDIQFGSETKYNVPFDASEAQMKTIIQSFTSVTGEICVSRHVAYSEVGWYGGSSTLFAATLDGGQNPAVVKVGVGVDSIVLTTAEYDVFRTGDKVYYSKGTGGTQIDGLIDGTDYFIVKATTPDVQLAATYAHAIAGVPTVIDLQAFASAAGTAHTLTSDFNLFEVSDVYTTEKLSLIHSLTHSLIDSLTRSLGRTGRIHEFRFDNYLRWGPSECHNHRCRRHNNPSIVWGFQRAVNR